MRHLQHLLDGEGIQYFSAKELTWLRRWDVFATVPEGLVKNILPTVRIAEGIRKAWGGPVAVISGFRPIAYNREVGSADTSQHVFFRALDLRPVSGDIAAFQRVAEGVVREHRRDRPVGLGLYDSFIHIDTGGHQHSRTWDHRRSK
jgi:uncharacterized protein YcbK (DUF882 family)